MGLSKSASADTPEFTIERSATARHARITVTPVHGVVVVAPVGMSDAVITTAVRERAQWIAEAQQHFSARREVWTADPATLLPDNVRFVATGERWHVRYRPTGSLTVRVLSRGDTLLLSGATRDSVKCLRALQRWLQVRAVERLVPQLSELAAAVGLVPTGVGVRGQLARWGGCSARGFVTLNRALLFLPPDLVRAVMLHELAHLRHPNHSAAFWAELGRLDVAMASHRVEIALAWDAVPGWAERQ